MTIRIRQARPKLSEAVNCRLDKRIFVSLMAEIEMLNDYSLPGFVVLVEDKVKVSSFFTSSMRRGGT